MKVLKILSVSFLLLQGCTHIRYPEIPEYKISKTGAFIVSESPELWRFYERSVWEKSRSLRFLVKNTDAKEQTITLAKSLIHINSETSPIVCVGKEDTSADVVLKSNQMIQVTCALNVAVTDKNQLGMKDTLARIEIPVKDQKSIQFERMFRIEEFQ